MLGHSTLKWHDLARAEDGISVGVTNLARDFLVRSYETGCLAGLGDLGFVILHRCGKEFYFLLLSTWKNDNELWESVYAKRSDEEQDFSEFTFDTHHRATFCVWELAVVSHEQRAWRNLLLSQRDDNSKTIYLEDICRGSA